MNTSRTMLAIDLALVVVAAIAVIRLPADARPMVALVATALAAAALGARRLLEPPAEDELAGTPFFVGDRS